MRNKIATFLVFLLGFGFNNTFAQITINSSDLISEGDTIRISTGLKLDFTDISETGEDFYWDFSQLQAVYQKVDTAISPWDMSVVYKLFFGLFSDFALRQLDNIPIGGFPLSDIYNFYDKTNSKFAMVGTGISIAGFPVPIKFQNEDIIYNFPLNYSDNWQSSSYFEGAIPEIGYLKLSKIHVDTVDGWGTLKTPYGEFEVLRIKSDVYESDSLYLDSLGGGLPFQSNYKTYKWIGKNNKLPLLEITSSFGGIIATYIDSARNIVSDVNEFKIQKSNSLRLWPIPTNGELNISFNLSVISKVSVEILDVYGIKQMEIFNGKLNFGTHDLKFNCKNLNSKGIYFVKLRFGNKNSIARFIYQ